MGTFSELPWKRKLSSSLIVLTIVIGTGFTLPVPTGFAIPLEENSVQKIATIQECIDEISRETQIVQQLSDTAREYRVTNYHIGKMIRLQTEINTIEELVIKGKNKAFNTMDLNTLTNLDSHYLDLLLQNTRLDGLGDFYKGAEETFQVNSLFLVGISAHESAWGSSNFAVKRNNLFGWTAYTDNPNKATRFNTKEDAINVVAAALKTNYLTSDGKYYNGYTVKDVNKLYAADPTWSSKVLTIMTKLALNLEEPLLDLKQQQYRNAITMGLHD